MSHCPACRRPMPSPGPQPRGTVRLCPCRIRPAFAAPAANHPRSGEPSEYDRPLALRLARALECGEPKFASVASLRLLTGADTSRVRRALACAWFRPRGSDRFALSGRGREALASAR